MADKYGFRVKIDSNEPGVETSNPSAALIKGPDYPRPIENHDTRYGRGFNNDYDLKKINSGNRRDHENNRHDNRERFIHRSDIHEDDLPGPYLGRDGPRYGDRLNVDEIDYRKQGYVAEGHQSRDDRRSQDEKHRTYKEPVPLPIPRIFYDYSNLNNELDYVNNNNDLLEKRDFQLHHRKQDKEYLDLYTLPIPSSPLDSDPSHGMADVNSAASSSLTLSSSNSTSTSTSSVSTVEAKSERTTNKKA